MSKHDKTARKQIKELENKVKFLAVLVTELTMQLSEILPDEGATMVKNMEADLEANNFPANK